MKEYIYSYDMNNEELAAFIQTQAFNTDSCMLLENIDQIKFDFYTGNEDFACWEQGRIFNREQELKWRRLGGSFRIVIITPQSDLKETVNKQELIPGEKKFSVFLWGIETFSKNHLYRNAFAGNQFIERAIPLPLFYPLQQSPAPGSRVRLSIQPYNDAYGHLKFYRFAEVNEVKVNEQ